MRAPVDAERLGVPMRRLGAAARQPGRVYLTGGATAVLEGWRTSTIDVDPRRLLAFFESIEPRLARYPAIDPASFRRAVEAVVARHST